MIDDLIQLSKHRGLLYAFAYRDIRIKYKQTIMGFMWAIFMPLLIVGAGIIVRYAIAFASGTQIQTEDVAGVAVRSVPWAFTVSSIRFGSSCLLGNAALVTKIYFPKETFPIAAMLSNLFDLVIASIPLSIVILVAGGYTGFSIMWVLFCLLTLIMIILGIVFFVSAAGLFFRDVKYIVDAILTFGIFFTPVFYTTEMLGRYGAYMLYNPIAPILETLEATLVKATAPDIMWLMYSFVFGLVVLLTGYRFFKRMEPAFAESI